MNVTASWRGLPELKRTLDIIGRTCAPLPGEPVDPRVKQTLMPSAEAIRDDAKQNAPVKTGNLQSAVFATEGDPSKPDVIVGVSLKRAPYAGLVEFGTSRMEAQPYFRPAVEANRHEIPSQVAPPLGRLIGETSKENAWMG